MRDTTDQPAGYDEIVRLCNMVEVTDDAISGDALTDIAATAANMQNALDALQARVGRLQRLWQAWQRAQGYAVDSRPYGRFLDALKACEDAGDLLPVED